MLLRFPRTNMGKETKDYTAYLEKIIADQEKRITLLEKQVRGLNNNAAARK